jgi:hypothetical protein
MLGLTVRGNFYSRKRGVPGANPPKDRGPRAPTVDPTGRQVVTPLSRLRVPMEEIRHATLLKKLQFSVCAAPES